MNNKNYFKNSNNYAEIGAAEITKYLESTGWNVTNVEGDKAYQILDIDLVAEKDGETVTIEIKADTYKNTPNYFCETVSNTSKGTKGCFYATKSDYIFYYFMEKYELHVIPTQEAQTWLRLNESNYKEVSVKTTGSKGEFWYSNQGRLVKQSDLQSAVDVQIIDFKQYFNIAC
ncbi:hypothetical protein [Clostridium chrysemydis]|uniref:hypothetical protein n=1 Tax=Clostridium chrysemydis TaxID=2665504 RepID=UPI001883E96F|nr:hypothetical protein [Clostridium chrysemydis]